MTNVYTLDEVARHNKENDLWMVMDGGVYDLTDFLMKHPGGEEVLITSAGKDGTQCFNDIGHSTEAILHRDTYKIGVISTGDKTTTTIGSSSADPTQVSARKEVTTEDDDWEYQEISEKKSNAFPVIVAAGVLIYSVLFYYLFL